MTEKEATGGWSGTIAMPLGALPTGIEADGALVVVLNAVTTPPPEFETYPCEPAGLTATPSGALKPVIAVPGAFVAVTIGVSVPSPDPAA